MTTVSIGGGFRLVSLPRKNGPQPPPPFLKKAIHPTQLFKSWCVRRALAGNLDRETAVILNQDDAGTLPNTGSIGGVTPANGFHDRQ
jgi:hypothetical protein